MRPAPRRFDAPWDGEDAGGDRNRPGDRRPTSSGRSTGRPGDRRPTSSGRSTGRPGDRRPTSAGRSTGRPGDRRPTSAGRSTGRPSGPSRSRPDYAEKQFDDDAPPRRGTSGLRQTDPKPREPWQPEEWIDEGAVRAAAKGAISRSARTVPKSAPKPAPKRDVPSHPEQTRRSSPLPTRFEEDLLGALGSRDASRFREQLSMAESAFRRERYFDARRTLAPLMAELAGVASARELYGLTLYRLGKWRVAAAELEAYQTLSGSVEHLPVLADCYRALRRHAKVAELWTELKAASPSAAVVAEGRIVMAGSLADRGDLRGAIALLRPAGDMPRRLRDHHVRTWYVLADLYDRSGDATAARQLFGRIREVAPGFADAEDRLAALGR